MILVLLAPLVLAALAFADRNDRRRPLTLLAGAALHLAGTAQLLLGPPPSALGGWLALDPLARIALPLVSLLFAASAVYAQGYLARRRDRQQRVFVGGLLVLLAALSAVALAQHLGVLWVAIEVTTLSTAPLLYFDRTARSLEAAWKYLLICSLGIALALLGTFFLALSGAGPGGPRSLLLGDLIAAGRGLSAPWVRAGFVFLLVGYGTKMGLAPLHAWKPDAYGEAPGLLGALLAAGVTSLGFVALARVVSVCAAAGELPFARDALVVLGLLSMAVAAVFVIGQRDVKRMLAYSSVEHMGILALGLGVGGGAASGAMFHMVNNGLVKGVLFLTFGNIHRSFGSKRAGDVRGAVRRLPLSGPLFLLGFLALTGLPPFSPFFSELAVLHGAVAAGRGLVAGLFLFFLAAIFVGMGATVLQVAQGDPAGAREVPGMGDTWVMAGPPLLLLAAALALGLHLPASLESLFHAAAAQTGVLP